jgi:hypothetical protein
MPELPWFRAFGRRCKAVREPREGQSWGRCDLSPHDESIDHALDRGFDVPRWSTNWSDGPASYEDTIEIDATYPEFGDRNE